MILLSSSSIVVFFRKWSLRWLFVTVCILLVGLYQISAATTEHNCIYSGALPLPPSDTLANTTNTTGTVTTTAAATNTTTTLLPKQIQEQPLETKSFQQQQQQQQQQPVAVPQQKQQVEEEMQQLLMVQERHDQQEKQKVPQPTQITEQDGWKQQQQQQQQAEQKEEHPKLPQEQQQEQKMQQENHEDQQQQQMLQQQKQHLLQQQQLHQQQEYPSEKDQQHYQLLQQQQIKQPQPLVQNQLQQQHQQQQQSQPPSQQQLLQKRSRVTGTVQNRTNRNTKVVRNTKYYGQAFLSNVKNYYGRSKTSGADLMTPPPNSTIHSYRIKRNQAWLRTKQFTTTASLHTLSTLREQSSLVKNELTNYLLSRSRVGVAAAKQEPSPKDEDSQQQQQQVQKDNTLSSSQFMLVGGILGVTTFVTLTSSIGLNWWTHQCLQEKHLSTCSTILTCSATFGFTLGREFGFIVYYLFHK